MGRIIFLFILKICFAIILVLLSIDPSWGIPTNIAPYVGEINREGPYKALIMADTTEEQVLLAANIFVPCNKNPWLDISGRRFNIGRINDHKIIYIRCGQRRLNAGVTVQMLIDIFDIEGVVHYGTAGNANNSLSVGDVSIPKYFAYTGSWKWTKFGANGKRGDQFQHLHFGDYNVPLGTRTNLLSSLIFQTEEYFSENSEMQEIFWMEATQKWFHLASKLEGLKLERCINSTFCLPDPPKVVVGLRASTADIFVDNAAYRDFLFKNFQVASVDEESAAITMVCLSSSVPVIVFRGLSDLAGGDKGRVSSTFSSLAAKNALAAAIAYLNMLQNNTQVKGGPHPLQSVDI